MVLRVMECWILWRKSRWWIMGACPVFWRWCPSYRRALRKFNRKFFFVISLQLVLFASRERKNELPRKNLSVCKLNWELAIFLTLLFLILISFFLYCDQNLKSRSRTHASCGGLFWEFSFSFFKLFILNLILCLVAKEAGENKRKEWTIIALNRRFRN